MVTQEGLLFVRKKKPFASDDVYNVHMSTSSFRFSNPLADRRSSPKMIAEALRRAIIEGLLSPGEILRQDNLAKHFAVSRIPVRERCPLCPRVEVLPMPEPIPRPTRLRFSDAFFGARIFDKFINKLSAFSSQLSAIAAVAAQG